MNRDLEAENRAYWDRIEAARMLALCLTPVTVTMGIGDPIPCGKAACGYCAACVKRVAFVAAQGGPR